MLFKTGMLIFERLGYIRSIYMCITKKNWIVLGEKFIVTFYNLEYYFILLVCVLLNYRCILHARRVVIICLTKE